LEKKYGIFIRFIGRPGRKRLLGRIKRRWEDNSGIDNNSLKPKREKIKWVGSGRH
jgi:hypothetical protein